jgi:hypothetical protein
MSCGESRGIGRLSKKQKSLYIVNSLSFNILNNNAYLALYQICSNFVYHNISINSIIIHYHQSHG